MSYIEVGLYRGFIGGYMLPDKVQCDRCSAWSIPHAIHYVYLHNVDSSGRIEQTLSQIVLVIECPECGGRTQTHDAHSAPPAALSPFGLHQDA
jgi:hypothetical protein